MKNTVIVTGATSGIGRAVCEALLRAEYPVIGVGRSAGSCAQTVADMEREVPGAKVHFIVADLMHQGQVTRAAEEIENYLSESGARLHALINNAGCVRSRYMTTQEGYEQQFALNHLAGFLLTHELMPLLKRDGAVVINTSSKSHKGMKINWNDLMFQKHYRPLGAYKQSKLCNLLFALSLREMGVKACGVHPGLVNTEIGGKNTAGAVNLVWNIRKKGGISPEESAKIFVSLCEDGFNGLYYGPRKDSGETWNPGAQELRPSSQVTHSNAARLYKISAQLCGVKAS